jgi:hypothetical protein
MRNAAAEQARLERLEVRELVVGRKSRMVGDVVGGAHEVVEGENRSAVLRPDQERGHRKVLVAVPLARPQLCCARHCFLPAA